MIKEECNHIFKLQTMDTFEENVLWQVKQCELCGFCFDGTFIDNNEDKNEI